jgi:predicted acylesterase/phospholipase RssA
MLPIAAHFAGVATEERASSALPGVPAPDAPYINDQDLLVDGGLVATVPSAVALDPERAIEAR